MSRRIGIISGVKIIAGEEFHKALNDTIAEQLKEHKPIILSHKYKKLNLGTNLTPKKKKRKK